MSAPPTPSSNLGENPLSSVPSATTRKRKRDDPSSTSLTLTPPPLSRQVPQSSSTNEDEPPAKRRKIMTSLLTTPLPSAPPPPPPPPPPTNPELTAIKPDPSSVPSAPSVSSLRTDATLSQRLRIKRAIDEAHSQSRSLPTGPNHRLPHDEESEEENASLSSRSSTPTRFCSAYLGHSSTFHSDLAHVRSLLSQSRRFQYSLTHPPSVCSSSNLFREIPRLCFVGTHSAGKSTILSRLAHPSFHLDIFPPRRPTRCPLRLTLRRTDPQCPFPTRRDRRHRRHRMGQFEVIRAPCLTRTFRTVYLMREWRDSEVTDGSLRFVFDADSNDEMDLAAEKLRGWIEGVFDSIWDSEGEFGFISNEIHVVYEHPDLDHGMEVIDYPGYESLENVVRLQESIVREMKKPNTLLVCVSDWRKNLEEEDPMVANRIHSQFENWQSRMVTVYSKCDQPPSAASRIRAPNLLALTQIHDDEVNQNLYSRNVVFVGGMHHAGELDRGWEGQRHAIHVSRDSVGLPNLRRVVDAAFLRLCRGWIVDALTRIHLVAEDLLHRISVATHLSQLESHQLGFDLGAALQGFLAHLRETWFDLAQNALANRLLQTFRNRVLALQNVSGDGLKLEEGLVEFPLPNLANVREELRPVINRMRVLSTTLVMEYANEQTRILHQDIDASSEDLLPSNATSFQVLFCASTPLRNHVKIALSERIEVIRDRIAEIVQFDVDCQSGATCSVPPSSSHEELVRLHLENIRRSVSDIVPKQVKQMVERIRAIDFTSDHRLLNQLVLDVQASDGERRAVEVDRREELRRLFECTEALKRIRHLTEGTVQK